MDDFLANAIGHTPLVRLERVVPGECGQVWLKLESSNPTGSYKDRMAVSIIGRAMERGDLKPGDRVVEYTGGSTGTALAFVGARAGLGMLASNADIGLVICDVHMPTLSGLQMVELLRSSNVATKAVAFVVLSNDASLPAMKRGMHARISAWIGKPVEPVLLLGAVKRLLGRPVLLAV